MKKTYLFFAAQYLPTAGGVERYTYNLACHLIAAGHHAIVVTSALPHLAEHEITTEGIEVFRLPSWLLMQGRLPVAKPCHAFNRLTKQLWANQIDFCVINTYFYPLSLYAAYACYKQHIRAILVNHGSAYLMTGNPLVRACGVLYEQCAARLVTHWCKNVYGVSGAACAWMQTFGVQTEQILSNAIDPHEVQAQALAEHTNWRTELGLAPDTPMICFVGRMIPEKGIPSLVDALPLIRKVHPTAVMVLAGEGALYEGTKALQIEGMYCVGKQSYAKTLALFAQSTVFCLPTRSEGFACTVLEAAALSCPILTTATGGSPQLVQDASYGTLLADMSASVIARACCDALADVQWCKIAGQKAKQVVETQFTWEQVTKTLLAISMKPE